LTLHTGLVPVLRRLAAGVFSVLEMENERFGLTFSSSSITVASLLFVMLAEISVSMVGKKANKL
jgi:hypothetical protein